MWVRALMQAQSWFPRCGSKTIPFPKFDLNHSPKLSKSFAQPNLPVCSLQALVASLTLAYSSSRTGVFAAGLGFKGFRGKSHPGGSPFPGAFVCSHKTRTSLTRPIPQGSSRLLLPPLSSPLTNTPLRLPRTPVQSFSQQVKKSRSQEVNKCLGSDFSRDQ